MNAGAEARACLRRRHYGTLSTISKQLEGYPFGSLVPYVLDHDGRPVILISRLAEHTHNIEADSRVSLMVAEGGTDAQANARVTLVGEARRCVDQVEPGRRYLRFFPDAERLVALGDFAFYAIAPRMIRYIGGFGAIQWISARDYAPPAAALAQQEEEILAHMNAEHVATLRDCCRYHHGTSPEPAVMVGIDGDGFDVRTGPDVLRFDFERPVTDAAAARDALVAMANKARAA